MSDQTYTVKVQTQGDPSGAEKVQDALKKTGAAGKSAGQEQEKGNKDAARAMNQLGEATERASAIGRIFGEVARGNIGALTQLGPLIKGIGAAAVASGWGALLFVLGAVASLLPGLIERMSGVKKETDDTASSFGKAKSTLEEFNELKLDALKAQLDEVKQRAAFFDTFQSKFDELEKRMRAARMNLELAQLGADSTLDPEERKRREFAIRERYTQQEQSAEDSTRQRQVDSAERRAQELAAAAQEAEAKAAAQRDLVGRARELPQQIARVMEEIRKQIADIISERSKLASSGDPANLARADSLRKDQQELQGTLDYLRRRAEAAQSPASRATGEEQQKQLAKVEAAAVEARKQAVDAQREAEEAKKIKSLEDSQLPQVRGVEARARRSAAGVPEPEPRPANPPAQVVAPGEISIKGHNGEEIGNRIAQRVEERIRAGEEAMMRALERRMRENAAHAQRTNQRIANGERGN